MIVWTKDETRSVCGAITDEIARDKTLQLLAAIHRAEDLVLPQERRRHKTCVSFYGPKTSSKFREAHQAGLRAPKGGVPVATPKDAPGVPGEVVDAELPAQAFNGAPGAEGVLDDTQPILVTASEWEGIREQSAVRSVSTVSLIAELVTRAVQEFSASFGPRLDRIEAALLARINPVLPDLPARPLGLPQTLPPVARQPVRMPQPVVAVVGLLKDQFEHVRQKVAHLPFRLAFIDKEDAHRRFPTCDWIIVQRFCAHGWFEAARKLVGPENVVFVDGAVSMVVQRICDIHARRAATLAGVGKR